MVSYRSPDGKQSYHQTEDLADAMQFVEHLRNAESVEQARIFKLEELSFEYRPYYRVELATTLPPPPGATTTDSGWIDETPPMPVDEGKEAETDPLAAVWTMTDRVEPAEGESVPAGNGAGMGRKGLFGR